jgi:hypothetical protein
MERITPASRARLSAPNGTSACARRMPVLGIADPSKMAAWSTVPAISEARLVGSSRSSTAARTAQDWSCDSTTGASLTRPR